MWNARFTVSNVCRMFCKLAPMYVDCCTVYWLQCMWNFLFTVSDICGLFCLLTLIYVECSVYCSDVCGLFC